MARPRYLLPLLMCLLGSPAQAQWQQNGGDLFYGDGKVGIGPGKQHPSYTLDINGVLRVGSLYLNGVPDPLTVRPSLYITKPTISRPGFNVDPRTTGEGYFLYLSHSLPYHDATPVAYIQDNGNTFLSGSVGIGTTDPPTRMLEVHSPKGDAEIGIQSGDNGGTLWTLQSSNMNAGDLSGTFQIIDRSTDVSCLTITSSSKTVAVHVLEIDGADIAEPFDISGPAISKGSVVVIDDDNPGKLKLTDRAYDKRVAGIVSGAHGINSGLCLRQKGFNDIGQNVALSGRVYVLADASNGPITAGDELTTSSNPGYCMKATDPTKARGAIIGKAMGRLMKGKGMILALVSLQ